MNTAYRPSLIQELCRWGYSTVLALLIPFSFINLMWRALVRSHKYNRRRFERYGFIPKPNKPGGVLVHCVSVGEVVAAAKLVKVLMAKHPHLPVTITTTTPTGSDRVQQIFADKVQHFYLPYDLPMAMHGMLNKVQPKMVLITEVELWPNMLDACWRKQIPTAVINARMTDKSAKAYAKIKLLFEPMLHKLTLVCAQGKRDYNNYLQLGLAEEKLLLSRNMKFDLRLTTQDKQQVEQLRCELQLPDKPILIAGSTHSGEEELVLSAFKTLLKHHPTLMLIVVPRHPERFEKAKHHCKKHGFKPLQLSKKQVCNQDTQVILGDTLGQLNSLYGLSDIAFVGGSIANRGGHNPLEPAAFGIPVAMGPHTFNNPEICSILQQNGALSPIEHADDLVELCTHWLNNPQARKKAGSQGTYVLEKNLGAIERTLAALDL